MNARRLRGLLPVVAFALLTSTSPARAAQQSEATPINTMCAVMPDEEVVPRYTLEYKGQLIGFCCRKCIGRFERDPEAFLVNLPDVFGDAAADAAARVVDLTPSGLAGARGTAADQEEESWLEGLFGRTHVLVVHFPIALLIAAALAELLAVARRSNALRSAAHYCVNLALPFAAWTFFSGNEMEEQARVGPMLHETLEQHELFGQITAGLVAGVFLLGWLARRPGASARTTTLWRLLLIASAVMVALTAHEGGQLVHGLGFPFD